jgi:ADP-heptose:LPS heptosyltransferase
MLDNRKRRFRFLIARADAARDAGRFAHAAALYEEASAIRPDHAGVRLQGGHMQKEAGRFKEAAEQYRAAQALRPNDAEVPLQLGHLFKVAARPQEARDAYAEALRLRPGWSLAEQEIAQIDAAAARVRTPDAKITRPDLPATRWSAVELARLVPALVPRPIEQILHTHREEIAVRRLGRRETTYWGNRNVLRGLEAIRGFYVADRPILEVEVLLNGLRIHQAPLRGGYALKHERNPDLMRKYVFNLWIDFQHFAPGLHAIELRFRDADDRLMSHHDDVVIAEPVPEADYPDSHFLVSLDPGDLRPVDEQVRERPSMLREAKRALFPDGVRNVLFLRTDQLGDVVASVPALRRLREIVPDANIVGLFTPANADIARTLDMIDEVIVIDFPDDRFEQRRLMSLEAQEELRRTLEPFQFDIAIDLAQAPVSRELMRLAGAKFTFGTGGGDWPWMSADFQGHTRDRWTNHDMTPHSTKVLGLIETLGALLKTSAPIIRRDDLSPAMLEEYGIGGEDRYALLHTGARINFSRWPHYATLAQRFLDETDLKVVMMTEDPSFRETMPQALLDDSRVVFLDRRLPFAHFDAFVSYATVMTGNDSGPKHLASLRGTNVVTIFSARINWTEWGQENVGAIISRRLPCAGCALLHDPEECGRDFACITDIRADEVFDAMMAYAEPHRVRA